MFLIMSAAYVGQELESEFGKIPPSFLPLGNRRLFQHQIDLIKDVNVYITVPESFCISDIDKNWLNNRGVSILSIPDGLNLGASLVAALNISGHTLDKPLHVLYGDTLYSQLPSGDDIATVSHADGNYNWAFISGDNVQCSNKNALFSECAQIIDGYFKFNKPRDLVKYITKSNWDFVEGLNLYSRKNGLTKVESTGWLDFGHVNTYYRSKAQYTTQRAFNELKITEKWVEKSSNDNNKIASEANWYSSLPNGLRLYIPQYLGKKTNNKKISYRLEYLHLTALNELFVFSKLSSRILIQVLSSCISFLTSCSSYKKDVSDSSNSLNELLKKKTKNRLLEFCKINNIDLESKWRLNGADGVSIQQLISDSDRYLPDEQDVEVVIHGDFCFSNILYDFRSGNVKVIDPRGVDINGKQTIYGDIRYDVAKLSHSILGLYDWIIAGYFYLNIEGNEIKFKINEGDSIKQTQHKYINIIKDEFGLNAKNLYAMQIHLFLSMLPLHADDKLRQKALFANAFRLHELLLRVNP